MDRLPGGHVDEVAGTSGRVGGTDGPGSGLKFNSVSGGDEAFSNTETKQWAEHTQQADV